MRESGGMLRLSAEASSAENPAHGSAWHGGVLAKPGEKSSRIGPRTYARRRRYLYAARALNKNEKLIIAAGA